MRSRRRLPVLLLGLLALVAASLACESSTSGSMVNSSKRCNTTRGAGSCTGTIDQITGTGSLTFEDDTIITGDSVDVSGEFSVGAGRLEVYVTAPDGTKSSAAVAPGAPGRFAGVAQGSMDKFTVYVSALDGEATDIAYSIEYQVR